jgi:TP901 family phage tail tape measure protein
VVLFGGNRSISVGLSVDPRAGIAGLKAFQKEVLDTARAGAQASQKHRRSYDDIANSIGAAGLAVGAFAVTAVVATAKFDKAMSRAGAATQATASQMTQLRAAALKAGADTQFSATQAADAITEMGKAGVQIGDILGGGLIGTLNLAAAGELEVARAAEIGATAMTQFGLKGSDLGRVADVLAAGAGKAQGSVEDLANALKYVGPLSNQFGISLEETTGALALFAKNGIVGEQAGTSLRAIIASLTGPSKLAGEEMQRLGINMFDASGEFIGLDGAAQVLNEKLGGLTEAQRAHSQEIIFGREAMTAATILYKDGAKAVNDWTGEVSDSAFAVRQARALMDNLSGDVEKLKGSLETAFISGGSGATEGLRDLVQGADSAVDAFNGLPSSVQEGTVKIAAFAAGGLLATAAALKLISAVGDAKANLQELGVTAGGARGTMIGLANAFGVVTVAVPLVAAGFDKLNDATTRSAPGIKETTNALLNFGKAGKASGAIGDLFGEDLAGIGKTAEQMDGLSGKIYRLGDQAGKVVIPLRGIGKPLEEQRAGLASVDQALADLVASGNQDAAYAAFKRTGLSLEDNKDLFPQYAEALQGVDVNSKTAADGQSQLAKGVQQAEQAAAAAKSELDGLISKVQEYADLTLNARAGAREYEAAIDGVSESIKTNGHSLDITTQKGRANAEALDAIARAGISYAESTLRQAGSGEQFRGILAKTRAELIRNYRQFDNNKGRAEAYADSILEIPSKAETSVAIRGIAAAQAALDGLIYKIGVVNGRAVAIPRREGPAREGDSVPLDRGADGMIIARMYADGGMENHVAQIARPKNTVRIWAEPETGGEAYIPLAPSKRQRSKAILKQTANIFGMQAFAAGGFSDPYGASDVQQRYEGMLPKPITGSQYAAAIKARETAEDRRRRAAISVDNAERDLARTRRKSPKDAEAIRDAEDRLNKARISYAAARRNEAAAEAKARDAVRRKNAPKGFNLGLYANALGQTVRQAEAYRRNLAAVEKRGGAGLAGALEAMGADGAPLIAALVKASPAQFKRIAALLRRLDPDAFGAGQKVTRFASGGIAPATMGGWRVIAEAGMDEAYIPLGQRNIARSRMLTDTTASRLGGRVQWSSHRVSPVSGAPVDGGGSTGRSYGSLLHADKVEVIRGGPTEVADEVMFRVRQLGG